MMVRFLAGGQGMVFCSCRWRVVMQGRWLIVRSPRWNHPVCLIVMPRCSLSYAKRVQTESRTTSPRLIVMPRCSLSYAKIGK